MSKVKEGDYIVAGQITERSISEITLPINYHFDSFVASTDNTLYSDAEKENFDKKFKASKDSLCVIADSVINKPKKILNTDILSAMQLAEKIFKSYPGNDRVLIIMSDMIQDTPDLNFETMDLTDNRCDQIIAQKTKNNELADLKDAKIYVTGANANNSKQFNKIQNFWMKYFKACKANALKENYGAALVSFNE